ncbi:MAG: bifunctional 4-hydroxy-2-oxoglutarate aldolase/2-dehydro-3-deoxy-phosphogluconate aldolase [Acidobacteriota bacterium]|jgi:2-dehydro-3-deoxyphosphogluconate aldolase/(4S)-4-hydroxy-2-oxoglutarate aldolase|nr:MAG: 2-dehydro-3-deoxyphosphogluconate aldolase [Acidobacteriota bacterium]
MSSAERTLAAIEDAGVVAVIRMDTPERLPDVVAALVEAGIRALEVTMTVPGAIEHIRRTAATLPDGFVLGAGTVTDADTVHRAIDAGASFIVSPVFRRAVMDAALARGAAVAPGCLTPTEILDAWDAGARLVKVFPATALGPGYLKDIHGPMPHVRLMPTGGVTVDNAGEWIAAGAVAVGVGSSLLDRTAIAEGRYEVIVERGRRMVANVRRARGQA